MEGQRGGRRGRAMKSGGGGLSSLYNPGNVHEDPRGRRIEGSEDERMGPMLRVGFEAEGNVVHSPNGTCTRLAGNMYRRGLRSWP